MTQQAERVYVVAASRSWHRPVFERRSARLPGRWVLFTQKDELTDDALDRLQPRYVFLPHWSYRIPAAIYDRHECVVFHMAPLPYGRGGSPLQNLIARGHRDTELCALRVVEELDAGPVYGRVALSLEGLAEEIYLRAAERTWGLIEWIVEREPAPSPQVGNATTFARRRPEQSRIGPAADLAALYDHIRMLDADGYPRAFIEHQGFRYELSRPALRDGRIVADVTIRPIGEEER